MSPDRRTVLKGAGVTVVGLGVGVIGWRIVADGDDQAAPVTSGPPPPEPVSSLDAALAAVGTRYLEDFPEEADQELLLAALPPLEGSVPEHPGVGLGVLGEQAAADHETGETVALDGWVLSRTEARAGALYAV